MVLPTGQLDGGVYMSGDNVLEKFIAKDTEEIAIVGSFTHASAIVLASRPLGYASNGKKKEAAGTGLDQAVQGAPGHMAPSPATALEDWGERDWRDARKRSSTSWRGSIELAPADRCLLIFWGQGLYARHPGHALLRRGTNHNNALDL